MRRLAWFSLLFGAGAALYVGLLSPILGFVLGAVSLGVFAGTMLIKRGWSRLALAILGLAAGLLWTACFDAFLYAPVRALDGQTLSFCATLRDDLQPTDYGARVYADAELAGKRCRILLYLDDMQEVSCGDRLDLTARLAVPGGEDYDLYYRSIGVDLIAYSRPGAKRVPADGSTLKTFPLRLRHALKEKIAQVFPADSVPFVQALLIGDRSGLSYAQKNALSVSGIAHTVAISGMHVSILLGMVLLLCGNRRWLAAIIGIPAVAVFTLMVGAMPSVVRAAIMQTLLLLAPLLMREYDPLSALGAAALCILVPNPWAITNVSFQLSFGAILGILPLSDRLYRRLTDLPLIAASLHSRFRPVVRYLAATICSTLGASVFTIPIVAWQFGQVSLMSFFTNLLTLWAVTLVFQASLAACVLGFLWAWPAKGLGWLIAWGVRYILAAAALVTRMPLSAVYTDSAYIIIWLVFLYAAFGVVLIMRQKQLILPCTCAAMLFLCLSLWLGYWDGNRGELQMTMLDVGQGQCLVCESDGVTLMYDCGSARTDAAGETAARYLLSRGDPAVDVLVLSHYDLDHAGGVCQLLERIPVGTIYLPDISCSTDLRGQIEAAAENHGTALHFVTRDETLTLGASRASIYAPMDELDENDASVALLYTQGDYDILATGDMSSGAERLLLSTHTLPDLEVLVAGHHGAATSTCETLLERLTPETVLISVGEGNSYGHPANDTLARIENSGAQLLRTDLCGNITIRR